MNLLLALSLTLAAAAPALPDSPLGRHVRAWFAAYENGSDKAIEDYANAHVGEAARAHSPLARRIEGFRSMKADHGALTIVDVPEDAMDEVDVVVKDAHGQYLELEFRAEPAPPHLLAGMRVETRDGPDIAPRAPAGPPLDDAGLARAVREELAKRPDFAGVVLVARGDKTLVTEARGLADRAAGTKITLDTKFNLASIGKAFTKVALAQLAAAGKLSLADPIVKFLPRYQVDGAEKITLAQLVDHRGGVDDVLDRVEEVHDRTTLTTLDGWLSLILDRPLLFAPGTSQRYSNGGYVLLGGAVAQASGEDYYDYVTRHVLAPAGMSDTGWPLAHAPAERRAEGYTRFPKGLRHEEAHLVANTPAVPVRDRLPERGSPAGGATSTAPDLLKFMRAMRASKLATPGWTAWVMGGPEPGPGATLPGGIGFAIAGGAPGTNGVVSFEGAYDVIILTNADPPNAEELARALRGLVRRAGA